MRRLSTLFVLLVAAAVCYAQNTTISATVTDSDSQTWNYGTWAISFIPGQSQPNPLAYTVNGSPVSSTVLTQTGTMSSGGALNATIYDTTKIAPSGSSWSLKLCPLASVACTTYNFTSTGSTMNLSTAVSAVAVGPRFLAVPGSYGYSDTEALTNNTAGATYWSANNSCQRFYNVINTTWACASSGASGTPGGANTNIQVKLAGIFAGDSGFTYNGSGAGSHASLGSAASIDQSNPWWTFDVTNVPAVLSIGQTDTSASTLATGNSSAGIMVNMTWSPTGSIPSTAFNNPAVGAGVSVNFDGGTNAGTAATVTSLVSSAISNGSTTPWGSLNGEAINSFSEGNANGTSLAGTVITGEQDGTGTITNLYGAFVNARSAAGHVTNSYGVLVEVNNTGSTVTNAYGVNVPSISGATNNWGFYTAGTEPNFFGGQIQEAVTSSGCAPTYSYTGATTTGLQERSGVLELCIGATGYMQIASTPLITINTVLGFSSGNVVTSAAQAYIRTTAAGAFSMGSTGSGTNGVLALAGVISQGTKFTASGCSNSATTGGATAGKIVLGANTCTVVITMNGASGLTAPNGWSCRANDITTAAGNTGLYFSANNATTATLTVPATAGSTDTIDFSCHGY